MLNKVMNTTLLVVTATFSIFVAYKCSEKSLKFTQKSRQSRDYFRFADYSFNPQRPNLEQSEKIKLNFYFNTTFRNEQVFKG